jgi:hypothetical protein
MWKSSNEDNMNPISILAETNTRALAQNPYPGRGIILGLSPDGKSLIQVYWIMGRSENSRNRVFVLDAGQHMRTRAFDESKLQDPSLIIYHPIRHEGAIHIVSNGDQTDTIYNALKSGGSFAEALQSRKYEPDAPNFTPRISGLINLKDSNTAYELSILKSAHNSEDQGCLRQFFKYEKPSPGIGHCITTYAGDGDPLPSFSGEPLVVVLHNDPDQNAEFWWSKLNSENRVSLVVKTLNLQSGEFVFRIVNKHRA